ncbi:hypothetical protein [Lysinibacillus sp. NPDC096259]|uniref:hypothetical protein n=1 Tax=Lysinibacillus sp. NPDC096259 TaxID=3390583 RepID=UPI003CFE8B68
MGTEYLLTLRCFRVKENIREAEQIPAGKEAILSRVNGIRFSMKYFIYHSKNADN